METNFHSCSEYTPSQPFVSVEYWQQLHSVWAVLPANYSMVTVRKPLFILYAPALANLLSSICKAKDVTSLLRGLTQSTLSLLFILDTACV